MNIGDKVRTFVKEHGENRYDGVGIIRYIINVDESYVVEKTTPIQKYNCIYKGDMIEKIKDHHQIR